eukprot:74913_1
MTTKEDRIRWYKNNYRIMLLGAMNALEQTVDGISRDKIANYIQSEYNIVRDASFNANLTAVLTSALACGIIFHGPTDQTFISWKFAYENKLTNNHNHRRTDRTVKNKETTPLKNRKLDNQKIREIKCRFNCYNDYEPSHCIEMDDEYKSKEKYSKDTIKKVVNEIDDIKSIFSSKIINEISEFATGNVVCCAKCKNVEFYIECDEQIDYGALTRMYDEKQNIWFCGVLTDEEINNIAGNGYNYDLDILKEELTSYLTVGHTYVVLCKECRYTYYCNEHSCVLKCIGYDLKGKEMRRAGSKLCCVCTGIFCEFCSQNWEDWGFADQKTTCTTCGWVAKKKGYGLM